MIKSYSVGEDIEAWCTKCKLELGHTIVAMLNNLPKKVKCNTCSGQHNYRLKPAQRKSSGASGAPRKRKPKITEYDKYLTVLAEGDFSNARKYTINGNFEQESMIAHSKFGVGVITSVVGHNKIEVLFKDGIKLLIQNHSL